MPNLKFLFTEPVDESHDPKTVIHEDGSLSTDLQIMMMTFLLLSICFSYLLFSFIERGDQGSAEDVWREPYKIGVLDPKNPHAQRLLPADKVFSCCLCCRDQQPKAEVIQLTRTNSRKISRGRTQPQVNIDDIIQSSFF